MREVNHDPQRVAVIRPCCIGDAVMALPALDALTAVWPNAAIDVFIGTHSGSVLNFRPTLRIRHIAESMTFQSALRLGRSLRQGRYDVVVALDRSRWIRIALCTSRVPVRASVKAQRHEQRHESEVYLDVVRSISVATPLAAATISPDDSARSRAYQYLATLPEPFAVLHPGGAQNPGAEMLGKRWPRERFVEVAAALQAQGIGVVLSGSHEDHEIADTIVQSANLDPSANLAGQLDLPTLSAVIERSSAFVGPDTGVSHIAAAIGIPTIVIFGPTNPRRYRPLGSHVVVLAPPESWTIPDRDLRRAHRPGDIPSTQSISVDSVVNAVMVAIAGFQGRRPCSR